MPKKGVSAEEKRLRLLNMFHESGAVFTMKDVEKGGSSAGIVSQVATRAAAADSAAGHVTSVLKANRSLRVAAGHQGRAQGAYR